MGRFSAMFGTFFSPSTPANSADTLDELRGHVNRLFIIITRSRVLIDRFERRLSVLDECAPAAACYMVELSRTLVDRLEQRLGAVMDRIHDSDKRSAYRDACRLCFMPVELSKIELMDSAVLYSDDSASLTIDEAASYLESLFAKIHVDIERNLPDGFYLRALA